MVLIDHRLGCKPPYLNVSTTEGISCDSDPPLDYELYGHWHPLKFQSMDPLVIVYYSYLFYLTFALECHQCLVMMCMVTLSEIVFHIIILALPAK